MPIIKMKKIYFLTRKSNSGTLLHSKSINSFPAGDSAGTLHNSVVTYERENVSRIRDIK